MLAVGLEGSAVGRVSLDIVILPPGEGAAGDLWGGMGRVNRTSCGRDDILAVYTRPV